MSNNANNWADLAQSLPSLLCAVLMLCGISFSLRPLTFGPLVIEARRQKAKRTFPLSDLVSLMVIIQLAVGLGVAISRRPGIEPFSLEWSPSLNAKQSFQVIFVLVCVTTWWWWDSAWLLNVTRLDSSWTRFTFLSFWTPLGYCCH